MSEIASAYRLQVDWDRDGYFCTDVQVNDPLNLIPAPVTFHGLYYYAATSNSTVALSWEDTDYGTRVWTVSNGGDAAGGIAIGQNEDAPTMNVIPVVPGTQYTVQVWVQKVSASGNADLRLNLVDPVTSTVVATTNFTPATDWGAVSLTFSANATQQWARIDILKQSVAATMTFKVAGTMLVEGSSAPSAFNAGDVSNPYDDIWSLCEGVRFSYGTEQYTEAVAPASSMMVRVNNIDGVFSPENPPAERSRGAVASSIAPVIETDAFIGIELVGDDGSWLRPGFFSRGMLARLQADYDGTTYTLYIGTLDRVDADAGSRGERGATLTIIDPVNRLYAAQYNPDLQLDVRTDEVLSALFDSGVLLYPYPAQYWLLGVDGASELGVTTWLFENRLTDFEQGDTTLEFAGDTTGAGVIASPNDLVRDVVGAELGGRFFWNARTAQFRFFRRTRDIRDVSTASAPGVLELDTPPEYVWADDLMNKVAVTYYPRVVGDAGSVMYTLGNVPMSLGVGQPRTMTVRYQVADALNASIAGQDMILPLSGVDFSATENADGTGADLTTSLTVSCNFHATSADLTFYNNGVVTLYVQLFQLRGTPLVSYRAVQTTAYAGDSIVAQGEFRRVIDLPALGDPELAESYANYLVQRYKQPIGRISAATISANRDAATMVSVLDMEIGDHLLLYDSFLNNQAAKVVVTGMTHAISAQRMHDLRLSVEPLSRYLYWILGDDVLSVLGTTTRLSI